MTQQLADGSTASWAPGAENSGGLTVSQELARETDEWSYEQLPAEVVHEAKRRVIDMLACVIGGFDSPPSLAIQRLVRHLGGPMESTICGSGVRTSAMNAALANGVMLRFTEAMDRSIEGRDGVTSHGHPGEVIPCILAVGERQHSTGQEVIAAIVLGYQLMNRLSYAMGGTVAVSRFGWKHEIRAGVILPLVVGKLLGLTQEQMVSAVGISGSFTGELGILDHGSEVVPMARDLRVPYAAYQAILAALMAQNGFEGPSRVFEGNHGFAEVMVSGNIDLARLTRRDDDFNIMYTTTKAYPVNGKLQGQTEALLRLVADHEITPERVARVTITTSPRVLEHMGDPGTHRYPQTKETADQSAYYAAAVAIVDRSMRLSLDQFTPERLQDPELRRVIDKVELVAVPEWRHDKAPTEVEIATVDGATYRHRVEHPKGHVLNPMTDEELEEKFRGMSSRFMNDAQLRRVINKVRQLDRLNDIGELMKILVFAP
jgi:2-methylcitrate dehydratase